MHYPHVLLVVCVVLLSAESVPLPAHADAADSSEYFDVVVPEVAGGDADHQLHAQPAGLLASDLSLAAKKPKKVKEFKFGAAPVIPVKLEAAKMRRAVQVALNIADSSPQIVRNPRRAMRNAMKRQLTMNKLGMRKVARKSILTKVIKKQSELEQKPVWLDLAARKIPMNPLLKWGKLVNDTANADVKKFEEVVRSQGEKLKDELERSAAEDSLLEIMEGQS